MSELSVKPCGNRVVIKEIKESGERVLKGGIIIPETVKDEAPLQKGEIVVLGDSDGFEVGQNVLFQWGDLVKVGGEKYYIVNETNIVAIV